MGITKADIQAELDRRKASSANPNVPRGTTGITKADIQAELDRRAQASQPQTPPSLGQRMFNAAEETVPFATGAIGGILGAGAAPFTGPAGPGMPFLGAGLGYGAGKAAFRGIRQATGMEPQQSIVQGLGDASKDVALGTSLEMGPLAAAKAAKGVIGAATSVAKTTLPGLLKVTANIPSEATRYAMDHASEVLKMTSAEARNVIDNTVGMARQGFNRFIAQKQQQKGEILGNISKGIGQNIRSMSGSLTGMIDDAKQAIGTQRIAAGVAPTRDQEIQLVLGRGGPKPDSMTIEDIAKKVMSLQSGIGKMDKGDAAWEIQKLNDGLQSLMSTSQDPTISQVAGGYAQAINRMASGIGMDTKAIAQEVGYRKGLQSMQGLARKFDNPLNVANGQDVTRAVDFLQNNAHRLDPKDAYKYALSTRKAIDGQMPNDVAQRSAAFLSDQRDRLSQVMQKLPGMEKLNDLDKVYHSAMEADRALGDAFTSPTKTKNFLNKVFSGEDPQSPEMMTKLMALEKRTGQPVLQNLQKLWERQKIVEGAKFPFQNEFSDPGSAEKFMEGLFVNGRTDPEAKYKLAQVKRIVGSQLVDEMFKGFAAQAFREPNMRSYVANRVIGGAATSAAMLPFMGLGHVAPWMLGTAAMGTMASRTAMSKALKTGAAASGLTRKMVAGAMTPRIMQVMTAAELLKNRRKQGE